MRQSWHRRCFLSLHTCSECDRNYILNYFRKLEARHSLRASHGRVPIRGVRRAQAVGDRPASEPTGARRSRDGRPCMQIQANLKNRLRLVEANIQTLFLILSQVFSIKITIFCDRNSEFDILELTDLVEPRTHHQILHIEFHLSRT